MKKKLLLLAIATVLSADSYHDNLTLDPDVLNSNEIVDNNQRLEKPLFVYAGIGGSYTSIKSSVRADKIKDESLDDISTVSELGLGLRFSKKLFATIFTQQEEFNNAKIRNVGLSANYQFTNSYIGLIGGNSTLSWNTSPVINTISSANTQKQIFYGFQLGYDYMIIPEFSIYTQYQMLVLNHTTNINDGASSIKFKNQSNITTGVKYAF